MAFAGDVGASSSIFVAEIASGSARQIVHEGLRAVDPAWAPNGSVIAFQSEATSSLHVVAPDGSDEHQLGWLTGTFLLPEWAPDGRSIAVAADVSGNSEIFTVSADGSVVTNVSNRPGGDLSPSWSPDGSRLAWGRAMGSGTRGWVVVANADGSAQVQLDEPADLAPPVWSPDGTRLYSYVLNEENVFQSLLVLDPTGVAPAIQVPPRGTSATATGNDFPDEFGERHASIDSVPRHALDGSRPVARGSPASLAGSVDPSTLQPPPPPGAKCHTAGNQIICDTILNFDLENQPDFDLPCGTLYLTGTDYREGFRFYVDGKIVRRHVTGAFNVTGSLSPTGDGPTIRLIARWNIWSVWPIPAVATRMPSRSRGA